MKIRIDLKFAAIALGSVMLVLQGCSSSDDDNPTTDPVTDPDVTEVDPTGPEVAQNASYTVRAVNLTAGQPLSPPLVVLHSGDYRFFTVGEAASTELEVLAEGGDNSDLVASLSDDPSVLASAAAENPLPPGATESWTVTTDNSNGTRFISVATMLVNTNDGITGINQADISNLAPGESVNLNAIAYDTGTEANSEATGTIPGPADGGEGFNEVRDDIADQVTMHSGVVTFADGLASSVLLNDHRFLNPVMRLTITRTE